MAAPFLYLDINDTGILACLGDAFPDQVFSVPFQDPDNDQPDGEREDAQTGEMSRFRTALDQLAKDTDISDCRHAVVLVPPSWISFRHTSLPFTQDKKIRQVLPLELAPCLPDSDAPFLTDFHVPVAPPAGPSDFRFEDNLHLIFSGTIPEGRMAEIYDDLSSMGISPRVVTPRGYAQAVAFAAGQTDQKNLLHIHIADRETVLTLMMDGRPLIVRSLPTNVPETDDLDREVHRTLTGAGLRAGLAQEAFAGIAVVVQGPDLEGNTADRIRNSLLEAEHSIGFIDPDPFPSAITPDSRPPFLLNFCIGPYKADSFVTQYKKQLVACLVMVILAFGLGVAGLYRQSALLEEQVAQVRQASLAVYKETFPKAGSTQVLAPLLLMESKVKQAKKTRSGNGDNKGKTKGNIRVMNILNDLSGRIPANIDMEIIRLVLNHGRLILTGATDNFNDVDKIKGLIQASPRFKNVSISSAEAGKTGKKDQKKQVRFKFIVEM